MNTKRNIRATAILVIIFIGFSISCSTSGSHTTARPGTVTLILDSITSFPECGAVYEYEQMKASVIKSTAADCGQGGDCGFGIMGDRMALFLGRLEVDVSAYKNISAVRIKIADNCGIDCTRAFLYNSKGELIVSQINNKVGEMETLVFKDSLSSLGKVAVSSCEGYVFEVSLDYN
jgi:hypothetical protein